MTRADPDCIAATAFDSGELTALWNSAYENYFVPIAFTESLFERHLRRASADLSLSRVLVVDGAPAGISLVGRRDDRAYLAGFGIAAAQRRRGLAGVLVEAQMSALSAAGLREFVLEVIEQNPARMLYRKAGFAERRPLAVLEGALGDGGATEGMAIDVDTLAAAHARCSAISRPTWRRELPTVLGSLPNDGAEAIGIARDEEIVGYAVFLAGARNSTLLDAGAIDDAAARALIDALARVQRGTAWRLVDEPTDSALFRAATERGMAPGIRQVEMKRPL